MVKWRTKMSKRDLFAMAVAECVGCALFIFTGLGSVLGALHANKYDSPIQSNSTGIALAFGFTISWIVHAVSHVKGGYVAFLFFSLFWLASGARGLGWVG